VCTCNVKSDVNKYQVDLIKLNLIIIITVVYKAVVYQIYYLRTFVVVFHKSF
jgi:hypothetical protein